MRLQGRVAIVTGAGRGIGRSIAHALAKEGAAVGLVARTVAELEAVAVELRALGARAFVAPCDLNDGDRLEGALAACEAALGPCEVLVNNAGIVEIAEVTETSRASWERVLSVNLTAPFVACRVVLPGMLARGRGRIVNVSSISATMGTPKLASYCASKWGLIGFTKALSEEVKGRGLLVASVLPGSTDTEMLRRSGFPPAMQPTDVAEAVRWLACEAPLAATGTALEVFG